jgi:large exoprotein involved in heme utilization and adhesion
VIVNATEAVTLSGRNAAGVASGLFSTASSVPPPGQPAGAAGRITVNAPVLAIADGGTISVATQNTGRAGDIVLGIGTLTLDGGARIDSSTAAAGQGGTVTVTATNAINLAASQVSSNATSAGAGGNIDLSASRISLVDGTRISATSTGTGNAGNIGLTARTDLVSRSSTVTTGATLADGGDITLAVGMLLHLVDSQITATVGTGSGGGGNIAIDPVFVILDGSEVRADAFGGPGGNIDIVAGTFLSSASAVSASSALGVQGTIDVSAGVTDVTGAVAPLPAALLQAVALLSESCATRATAGRNSTLVVRTRDGVPPEPGGALPSDPIVAGASAPRRAQAGPPRGAGRLALVRLRCGGS